MEAGAGGAQPPPVPPSPRAEDRDEAAVLGPRRGCHCPQPRDGPWRHGRDDDDGDNDDGGEEEGGQEPRRGCRPRSGLGGGSRAAALGGLRAAAGLWLRPLGTLFALALALLLGCARRCARAWHLLHSSRGEVAAADHDGSSDGEVTRLLALAEVPIEELDPFEVLGAAAAAPDAELRRAYRRLAVLVHPDKNEHPRAAEAFRVLRAAWDVVSSPERRKEHEIKRRAHSELTRSVGEFLSRLQDDLREAMNTMMCSKCQGKHKRFELDRDPLSARYCAECSQLHPAEEGDFWAESSLLGLKITYLAMMDGKVYDITEWAGCQRVGIAPDTHRVPYHISFGPRGTGGRQRAPAKGSADLHDFFSRMFQGTPGAMPGGTFSAPAAAASSGSSPKVDGAIPKGDMKHKRRKKVRRPFQR